MRDFATLIILERPKRPFVIFSLFPGLVGEDFRGCQLVKWLLLAIQYHQDLF